MEHYVCPSDSLSNERGKRSNTPAVALAHQFALKQPLTSLHPAKGVGVGVFQVRGVFG